jgi:hypothetical protein
VRSLAILLCLLAIACTGIDDPEPVENFPPDRLNPAGSPWGPPPDPLAEPEIAVTFWGIARVHTRGYAEVSIKAVEDAFYEAAKVCEPEPGAFQVEVYIEPELFKIDGQWSAGATAEGQIWVVGYYEAWDGRIARYDELLFRELVDHLLECNEGSGG